MKRGKWHLNIRPLYSTAAACEGLFCSTVILWCCCLLSFCSSPASPRGSYCSSGWSLFPKSRTPPHTPARPTWDTAWCAPPSASSSRLCLPSHLPPSHSLPSEPATQGETQCLSLLFQLNLRQQLRRFTHLVNKIQCNGPLPDPHLFWLPVVSVLSTNPIHALF